VSKFKHMSEREVISHIENLGTEDEKELLAVLQKEPDWSECPECVSLDAELNIAESKIAEAREVLGGN